MRIEIFDVGHGQCVVITSPIGERIMLDCGTRWRSGRFWTPSLHYFRQHISVLGLLNLDEDHLSDFGRLMERCSVGWVLSNPTIGPREFATLKQGGMGAGTSAFAAWLARPKGIPIFPVPDFSPVQVRWYCNRYGYGAADDTNNLSLVVVVQYGAFKIVFAGDLEECGWRQLLAMPEFCIDLMGANILVASHHGRKSGCCAEIFDLFRPEIVIISDDERQYDSQNTDDWYRAHCRGAVRIFNPFERRYVMTTRSDGSMRIEVSPDGGWILLPVTVEDWPQYSPPRGPIRKLVGRNSEAYSATPYGLFRPTG